MSGAENFEFDHEYGLKLSCSDDGLQSQSPLSTSLPVSFGISHPELQSGVAGVIRETGPLLPMTTTKESYIPQMPEPPQVSSKSGREMGLVSKLDPRAWLEVVDTKHRYTKNLRAYYQAWDLLGEPLGDFFEWLNSESFELDGCPRSTLESDVVHYCTLNEARTFALSIDHLGRLRNEQTGQLLTTGETGWIFVLHGGVLYSAEKRTTSPRFHHSSFFAGGAVEVAGIIAAREGRLTRVYPHSGHYRPRNEHVLYLLRFLEKSKIDLSKIEVDGQHTMKVARLLAREGGRMKKIDRPHFLRGDLLLSFLEMKEWSTPLFDELRSYHTLSQTTRKAQSWQFCTSRALDRRDKVPQSSPAEVGMFCMEGLEAEDTSRRTPKLLPSSSWPSRRFQG